MALTRPKTPKKEESGSPPSSARQSDNLRSPIADAPHSRSSSKTPVHSSLSNDQHNNTSALISSSSNPNSSSKVTPSPVLSNEKSNYHNESLNNNGLSGSNHNQQYSSQLLNGPDKVLPSPSTDRKDFDFSKVNGE